jgi:hypothetical protein
MNAHEQLEGRAVTVPDMDLTVEASRLICSVFDAVQRTNWPVSRGHRADATPEPVLQSLVVYCYAVGILASDEIEYAARNDAAVQYLCANYEPDATTIRNFRRGHLPFVKSAMANLFKGLAQVGAESYYELSMGRLGRYSPNHNFHSLAEKRIARAIAADSHALDV